LERRARESVDDIKHAFGKITEQQGLPTQPNHPKNALVISIVLLLPRYVAAVPDGPQKWAY
jgi:hypothetical protein